MGRDVWSKHLRMAGVGAGDQSVEEVLTGDIPVDGLQYAGSTLLRAERSDVLVGIAGRLIEALGERRWIGDEELIGELEHYVDGTDSDLVALPVDLDQLIESLDQSGGSTSYIDLETGKVWPSQFFEFDENMVDFDPESEPSLEVCGLGSRSAYAVMARFIDTVENPEIKLRLNDAIAGSGAFRRFRTILSQYEAEFTRWHRYRQDAGLGRARAWLAEEGYRTDL